MAVAEAITLVHHRHTDLVQIAQNIDRCAIAAIVNAQEGVRYRHTVPFTGATATELRITFYQVDLVAAGEDNRHGVIIDDGRSRIKQVFAAAEAAEVPGELGQIRRVIRGVFREPFTGDGQGIGRRIVGRTGHRGDQIADMDFETLRVIGIDAIGDGYLHVVNVA